MKTNIEKVVNQKGFKKAVSEKTIFLTDEGKKLLGMQAKKS